MRPRRVFQSLLRASSSRRRRGFATLALTSLLGLGVWLPPGVITQNLGQADPLVSAALSMAYGSASPAAPPSAEPVTVDIELGRAVHRLDPRFLSIAIDTSQLVGGHFWSKSGRVEVGRGAERVAPFDVANPELLLLAQALAPAYLRIGGTEADHLYYAFDGSANDTPPGYELRLEPPVWDRLVTFVDAAGLDLFFTLNAGPGPRAGGDRWQPENAASLMRHAQAAHQKVAVWELGNELNGYWFIHGLRHQPNGAQYAADMATLRPLVQQYSPSARVAGPGSLFWPVVGEPLSVAFGILDDYLAHAGNAVDIITWHYYPQQSRRCPVATRRATPQRLLDPANLDEVSHWSAQVATLRDRSAPGAELWLGETGNAQCGGEPGVSDRFGAGLWWLDQLGLMAHGGQSVVVRQTLAGSDYGLLDPVTYRPNPDYWNSLLWKRLMGSTVLDVHVSAGNPFLRVYAHCAVEPSGAGTGSVTLLALNTHPERGAAFRLEQAAGSVVRYGLSAPSLGSSELHLNGLRLELQHGGLPELRGEPIALDDNLVQLAPAAYAFLVLDGVGASACAAGGG